MVAVHRQQRRCQHLAWAHSGLLMPLCPVLMAWNVCSPILPVSLQCRSGDVTNCRPPARAPSCHCSTTLPPSCAFSFQLEVAPRPCPDPPSRTLSISHIPGTCARQELCEAEQAFCSRLCRCPPGQFGQLGQGLSAPVRGGKLVRQEAVTTSSPANNQEHCATNPLQRPGGKPLLQASEEPAGSMARCDGGCWGTARGHPKGLGGHPSSHFPSRSCCLLKTSLGKSSCLCPALRHTSISLQITGTAFGNQAGLTP